MYTASRGTDYFAFSIIPDCRWADKAALSGEGLGGEGARCCAGVGAALPGLQMVPSARFYQISWAYLSPE